VTTRTDAEILAAADEAHRLTLAAKDALMLDPAGPSDDIEAARQFAAAVEYALYWAAGRTKNALPPELAAAVSAAHERIRDAAPRCSEDEALDRILADTD
jgi:hypothetical protein